MQAATIDGDSSAADRDHVCNHVRIALSNPDMLHHCLLRNHLHWQRIFRNLRFCVLDEAHVSPQINSVYSENWLPNEQGLMRQLVKAHAFKD